MRLILMAHGRVGEEITRFLVDNYPEDLALIVTERVNEISTLAENYGVPNTLYQSDKQLMTQLEVGYDLGVLAWWPHLLKPRALDMTRLGFVNTHPSLLPHHRGKHSSFWALMEQAPFGVTVHEVDAGIDTGSVLAQSAIEYSWCDTGETLHIKAQDAMVALFEASYPLLRAGMLVGVEQEVGGGSFHLASEIESAKRLDLGQSYLGRDLINLLRAGTFGNQAGCWFEDAGRRYEVSISIKETSI